MVERYSGGSCARLVAVGTKKTIGAVADRANNLAPGSPSVVGQVVGGGCWSEKDRRLLPKNCGRPHLKLQRRSRACPA